MNKDIMKTLKNKKNGERYAINLSCIDIRVYSTSCILKELIDIYILYFNDVRQPNP